MSCHTASCHSRVQSGRAASLHIVTGRRSIRCARCVCNHTRFVLGVRPSAARYLLFSRRPRRPAWEEKTRGGGGQLRRVEDSYAHCAPPRHRATEIAPSPPPGGLACVAVEPGIGSGVLLLRGLESRGPVAGSPIRRLGGLDDLGGRGGAQIRLDGRAGVEVSSQVSGVGCAATDDVAAARPSGARPSMRPGLPTGRRTDRCASRGCQPISRAGMGGHSCGEREARTTTTAAPTTTTRPPSPPNAVPSDPTPADPQQESPFTAALRSPFPPDHIQISFCASDCAQIPDPCRRSPPRCRPSTTEQKHGADADARGGRDGTGSWLTARPGKIGCRGGCRGGVL
ncbi:hypothetical protein B2J93_999 [Marssonina coronariae]|uniref:Uncharacterized protein n=1 Tax=Diplocarpon coronariae TaxID=2795749 RepID=A0A218ZCT3_9HELO|nr:hypothetical protein B2J93_999 [Marssonina coronariae]